MQSCFSVDSSEDDDSEWAIPENSSHSIGSNGNHDLAHSVVQVHMSLVLYPD